MEYTVLGNTGRRVSRIGFGGATAGIHNYISPFDPADSRDRENIILAIRRALELGVNYFDTAEGYGDGASEGIFGEGLDGVNPTDIFLATKMSPGGDSKPRSPDDVRRTLEASLRRLKRDYVDLIQIHGSYYSTQTATNILKPGGIADALLHAKEEGLVKFIGFSIEAQNTATDMLIASGCFDCVQMQYNLLFQHPYDPSFTCGSFYQAEAVGMGIVTMRSVTSGIFRKWIRLVNPHNAFDYTPSLLQFVLSNPLVDTALVGMRSVNEVEQNVKICNDISGRIDIGSLHHRFP